MELDSGEEENKSGSGAGGSDSEEEEEEEEEVEDKKDALFYHHSNGRAEPRRILPRGIAPVGAIAWQASKKVLLEKLAANGKQYLKIDKTAFQAQRAGQNGRSAVPNAEELERHFGKYKIDRVRLSSSCFPFSPPETDFLLLFRRPSPTLRVGTSPSRTPPPPRMPLTPSPATASRAPPSSSSSRTLLLNLPLLPPLPSPPLLLPLLSSTSTVMRPHPAATSPLSSRSFPVVRLPSSRRRRAGGPTLNLSRRRRRSSSLSFSRLSRTTSGVDS
jgi:hypothetical protein